MGSKSDVSAFFRLRFRNGSGTKPAGVLLFRMRVPNTFFLSLAWWLASFFFVFSRFQKQRFGSFLAAVSHGLGTISFFLMGSKSDVSAFFRLQFRNGLFAWLGHNFFVFSLFLVGSKSDVSAFFRLRFRNGLGTKPAGALPFRMRSRRSFLRLCLVAEVSLCLVAEVSQWLGHDSIVFRGSKSNVSRFLRLQFRNGLDGKPAGALPFRTRSRRSFLRLCLVAEVSQWSFQKQRFGIFLAAVSRR